MRLFPFFSRRYTARPSRFRLWTRRLTWLALAFIVADVVYLANIWPDWSRLAKGPIPRTNFMAQYDMERVQKHWPRIAWQPVALNKLPKHLIRAVLVAEDSRFFTHSGFDLVAIKEAWDYNWAKGNLAFGASTISQQTTKNLFLTSARTPLRKWHELVLTLGLEFHLSKNRVLEIYLSTAEFGRGIYGVEAAARAYWGISATELSVNQAVELAATLPGPVKHNPATRSRYFTRHSRRIFALLGPDYVDENRAGQPVLDTTSIPPAREPPPKDETEEERDSQEQPPQPSRPGVEL